MPSARVTRLRDRVRAQGRQVLVLTAAAVLVLDTVSKVLAVERGGVHLNPGIAFGVLASRPGLALLVSSMGTLAVTWVAWQWSRGRWWGLGWGLVVGGALGNAVDRWIGPAPAGVVDWIRVPFYPAYFNLADVAIRCGGILVLGLAIWSMSGEWRAGLAGFPSRDRPLHSDPPAPRSL